MRCPRSLAGGAARCTIPPMARETPLYLRRKRDGSLHLDAPDDAAPTFPELYLFRTDWLLENAGVAEVNADEVVLRLANASATYRRVDRAEYAALWGFDPDTEGATIDHFLRQGIPTVLAEADVQAGG